VLYFLLCFPLAKFARRLEEKTKETAPGIKPVTTPEV